MTLAAATKLGPYEIVAPLGAGGMGEVYRATDTRLHRTVAIKVLASHLSSTPELKQRMEREARTISSLNHPHICQLFDIGSQNGTDFLVMEFLEGETLAQKLRRGPLPLNEVLKIAMAVAEALTVAHRQGIVHRDLKPSNIMLAHSGVKLMDFGLAKPLGQQAGGSGSGVAPAFSAIATATGPSPLSPLTTAGEILGTIQYMSPEQIEGKEADARSDIFAFGTVLYEMSTGKRPFEGKSQLSLASAILEKDPEPLSAAKPLTPPALEHVVNACLQKDPEQRYQNAHDIKLELEWIASDRSSAAVAPAPPTARWERWGWAAAVVVAVALGLWGGRFLSRSLPAAMTIRSVIDPPTGTVFSLTGDLAGPPVLSPDGLSIAFTANDKGGASGLWVRPVNSLDAHMLPGTEGAIFPFWSPDSRSLGFFANAKLKTVDLNGGTPQVLADTAFGRGGAWGPDGVIVFSPNTQAPLMKVSADGGTPVAVTKIDSTKHTSHRWPFFLPDGKHFIYAAIHHDLSQSPNNAIYYASLDGREDRPLLQSQSNGVYAGGYLLFARGSQLMAQRFDPASGTLSGEAQPLASGVMNDVSTWHLDASAADNGLLVFGSGGSADWQLVWLDRSGKELGTVADKLTNLQIARISPQGDRIAFQLDTGVNDIWVLDLARGVRTRLTFGPVSNDFPVWSPDGKWIAYASFRDGHANIYRKPSDGSGAEERLLSDQPVDFLTDWSRDGKYILYMHGPAGSDWEVWVLPLEGDRKPWRVVARAPNSIAADGHLSPDGRWVAYTSTESGTLETYVVPFRGGQGKWQVSTNGGGSGRWSKDGKQLYYLDRSFSLYSVPVKEVGGALQFGSSQMLVHNWSAPNVFFDVTPDGKKILLDRVAQQVSQSVTVVTNFTAGLKK